MSVAKLSVPVFRHASLASHIPLVRVAVPAHRRCLLMAQIVLPILQGRRRYRRAATASQRFNYLPLHSVDSAACASHLHIAGEEAVPAGSHCIIFSADLAGSQFPIFGAGEPICWRELLLLLAPVELAPVKLA